jgi:glyoxylase-like metal-dependent hydrolase (beta-lactamase superfamily II)
MRPSFLAPSQLGGVCSHELSRRALLRDAGAAGLAVAIGGVLRFAPSAEAQESTPAVSAAAATHRFRVGQIEVVALNDGLFPGQVDLFAVNAPDAALAAAGLTLTDPVNLSVQPLLVETAGQRVLLDTGIGGLGPAPGALMAALAAEGIAPEEIDVVLLTHFHIDHYGGTLDPSGGLAFPNARYLISGVEHEYWSSEPTLDELVTPDDLKAFSLAPIKDVLAGLAGTIERIAPGDEIAPGITTIDARGHTPGHLAVEIASEEEVLLHIVDAAHIPEIHLEHPDWFMAGDNWPAWSVTTRKALFDRAADENLLVSTYHFPFPGVGRVTKDEIGWVWTAEG